MTACDSLCQRIGSIIQLPSKRVNPLFTSEKYLDVWRRLHIVQTKRNNVQPSFGCHRNLPPDERPSRSPQVSRKYYEQQVTTTDSLCNGGGPVRTRANVLGSHPGGDISFLEESTDTVRSVPVLLAMTNEYVSSHIQPLPV